MPFVTAILLISWNNISSGYVITKLNSIFLWQWEISLLVKPSVCYLNEKVPFLSSAGNFPGFETSEIVFQFAIAVLTLEPGREDPRV